MRMTTIETLIDDAGNRKKFEVMSKIEVMVDDSRNDDLKFWQDLDDFLEWGGTYRITVELIHKP